MVLLKQKYWFCVTVHMFCALVNNAVDKVQQVRKVHM